MQIYTNLRKFTQISWLSKTTSAHSSHQIGELRNCRHGFNQFKVNFSSRIVKVISSMKRPHYEYHFINSSFQLVNSPIAKLNIWTFAIELSQLNQRLFSKLRKRLNLHYCEYDLLNVKVARVSHLLDSSSRLFFKASALKSVHFLYFVNCIHYGGYLCLSSALLFSFHFFLSLSSCSSGINHDNFRNSFTNIFIGVFIIIIIFIFAFLLNQVEADS